MENAASSTTKSENTSKSKVVYSPTPEGLVANLQNQQDEVIYGVSSSATPLDKPTQPSSKDTSLTEQEESRASLHASIKEEFQKAGEWMKAELARNPL